MYAFCSKVVPVSSMSTSTPTSLSDSTLSNSSASIALISASLCALCDASTQMRSLLIFVLLFDDLDLRLGRAFVYRRGKVVIVFGRDHYALETRL